MNDELNYLMTSDFNEGLAPEKCIELLLKFRYEYRLLSGKNSSMEKEIEKLILELENKNVLYIQKEDNLKIKAAKLEDELHLVNAKLNKKLTLKERFFGIRNK